MKSKTIKQITFLSFFLILFAVELFIALYVHDNFFRPYVGDILVVPLIWSFIRIFVLEKCRFLSVFVFIFASLVELFQFFRILELLGLSHIRFLAVIVGTQGDFLDIACYAAGGLIAFAIDFFAVFRPNNRQ